MEQLNNKEHKKRLKCLALMQVAHHLTHEAPFKARIFGSFVREYIRATRSLISTPEEPAVAYHNLSKEFKYVPRDLDVCVLMKNGEDTSKYLKRVCDHLAAHSIITKIKDNLLEPLAEYEMSGRHYDLEFTVLMSQPNQAADVANDYEFRHPENVGTFIKVKADLLIATKADFLCKIHDFDTNVAYIKSLNGAIQIPHASIRKIWGDSRAFMYEFVKAGVIDAIHKQTATCLFSSNYMRRRPEQVLIRAAKMLLAGYSIGDGAPIEILIQGGNNQGSVCPVCLVKTVRPMLALSCCKTCLFCARCLRHDTREVRKNLQQSRVLLYENTDDLGDNWWCSKCAEVRRK